MHDDTWRHDVVYDWVRESGYCALHGTRDFMHLEECVKCIPTHTCHGRIESWCQMSRIKWNKVNFTVDFLRSSTGEPAKLDARALEQELQVKCTRLYHFVGGGWCSIGKRIQKLCFRLSATLYQDAIWNMFIAGISMEWSQQRNYNAAYCASSVSIHGSFVSK